MNFHQWNTAPIRGVVTPGEFVAMARTLDPRKDRNARAFWSGLRGAWSSFGECEGDPEADHTEAIDPDEYSDLFAIFRVGWRSTPEIDALPETITIWRGQHGDEPPGLCWTLKRATAEGFAWRHPERPVILSTTVRRSDVALCLHDRDEAEVVLFAPPDEYEEVYYEPEN